MNNATGKLIDFNIQSHSEITKLFKAGASGCFNVGLRENFNEGLTENSARLRRL